MYTSSFLPDPVYAGIEGVPMDTTVSNSQQCMTTMPIEGNMRMVLRVVRIISGNTPHAIVLVPGMAYSVAM